MEEQLNDKHTKADSGCNIEGLVPMTVIGDYCKNRDGDKENVVYPYKDTEGVSYCVFELFSLS